MPDDIGGPRSGSSAVTQKILPSFSWGAARKIGYAFGNQKSLVQGASLPILEDEVGTVFVP
jgi:hypothetical protein